MKYAQSRWQGRGWKYNYGRADFLKFVGPSGQKITRTGNTAKYASPGVQQKIFVCVFCFAPEIGNAIGMPERARSTRN